MCIVDEKTFSIVADNLFEGQSYFFRVTAENQAGWGESVETRTPAVAKLPYGMWIRFGTGFAVLCFDAYILNKMQRQLDTSLLNYLDLKYYANVYITMRTILWR